ncbi:LmeA family phospholipid-binding protein [Nocardia sp. CDC159]|uniref:LmeA family phospholipid-binding protein n=1 Tax=Nocardia pulmonis TaxID=2951408 RepID=A0A9X2E3H8_9NOCA|nr:MULTISPECIES: LmeA family phospholipid-binding protein [Nocardia]MCM6772985.1 LmeA family phospholipid-binding protein [Nocardia pulmonis]MCM6785712.1 LmeA family phospholipid-binding protein [Nocardia sp. CDC159]
MRKVIVGVLLVAALAVVADFTAAAYTEYRVSRALRAGGDLSADPEVTIHGFPFVVQAWRGDYRNVEIRARANHPEIPGEILVESTLEGVRIPIDDLVDGKLRAVPVDRVAGRMRIDSLELGRLLNIPNLSLTGPPADKSDGTGGSGGTGMTTQGNTYLLSGTIQVGPESRSTTRVSVKVNLLLDGDQVRVVATDIYRGNETDTTPASLGPDLDKAAVLARFTRTIDTRDLPFGVHPTKVQALGGDIIVEGEGRNMTLEMNRFARS